MHTQASLQSSLSMWGGARACGCASPHTVPPGDRYPCDGRTGSTAAALSWVRFLPEHYCGWGLVLISFSLFVCIFEIFQNNRLLLLEWDTRPVRGSIPDYTEAWELSPALNCYKTFQQCPCFRIWGCGLHTFLSRYLLSLSSSPLSESSSRFSLSSVLTLLTTKIKHNCNIPKLEHITRSSTILL